MVETTFQRASPLVGQAGLDVAVVAIDPAVPDLPAPMSYKAMERAAATADPIEAHGHRTPGATSTVTAIVLQHLGPPPGGAWRDTFLTMHAVSVGGDSGAMVLHQQTHELVGHVVGGHSNAYSIVQDATAQLAALGATLR